MAAVLAILLLAGVVASVTLGNEWRDDRERSKSRTAAVSAARDVAVALATINFKTAADDIARVSDLATGAFAEEVATNLDGQTQMVKKFKVVSTGKVIEAGVVSEKGGLTTVAVAVASTVKNSKTGKGEERWYRMTIEMKPQDDGRWLASKVEFVQ
ncbi:hypothetical protein ASD81_16510 [Nocardioides sp. Root614]|nr:hypothetical protein ASD81_16510 [Nocardioides sp. Root614]KRA87707.1 hypothetical protein ASD84_16780 [Nocardioides sp. Root682]